MLTLLLGSDDFSKKQYIKTLAAKTRASLEVYGDPENPPEMENLVGQDLFAGPKIFVLENLLNIFGELNTTEKLIASKNTIIFIVEKIDKRVAANKELLVHKQVEVKEFNLPHGRELDKWLGERVKFFGGKISTEAINSLAVKLGRDEAKETKFGGKVVSVEEVFSLWQADSEIQKLIAFAAGGEISPADVEELISESGEVDALQITNALAEQNKDLSFSLINKFLKEQSASDEKGNVIRLNALLADQFRSIALAQAFLEQRRPETEILAATAWKPGRLFVMKKFAARFSAKKVLDFLAKLKALDEELKSGQVPPKVLLDLIIIQLL